MESIPSGADVMVVLGEIDCREGLLVCVEKGRYASLEEGIQVVISIFLQNVKSLAARKKFGKVYIHPVAPVLNPTRHIVETFNPIFEARVREAGAPFVWLDFVKNLVEPAAEGDAVQDCQSKNRLKSRYELDGTHLNPLYISENVFLN